MPCPGPGIASPARKSRSRVCCSLCGGFAFSDSDPSRVATSPRTQFPLALRLTRWLRGARDGLASIVFAAPCRLCEAPLTGASRIPVCESCLGRVRQLEPLAFCDRCQLPLSLAAQSPEGIALCGPCRQEETVFNRLRSFGAYDAELRQLIVLLKYNRLRPLARPLGGWLATVVQQNPDLAEVDAILRAERLKRHRGLGLVDFVKRLREGY